MHFDIFRLKKFPAFYYKKKITFIHAQAIFQCLYINAIIMHRNIENDYFWQQLDKNMKCRVLEVKREAFLKCYSTI